MIPSAHFQRLIALAALIGVSAYLPTVAAAQTAASEDAPRAEKVSYADINLATPAGQKVLQGRIHAAAKRVCEPEPDASSLQLWQAYKACMGRAQNEAMQIVAANERAGNTAKLAELTPKP